ncbi:GNAT family N-acetyltransferase [Xenorhabdus innexi]|uniref:N-acetyltransferase n=1 Tax=Xenorhabdus innexi TaxID=290109 RepID=A0A1N6N1M0_9GAMM|nr:GNAT family N-acetyltransferase [Xenorhabdus innexi]PHM37228.1 N-acetyltransferase [Xenorhabdus innexi]SIP74991.1 conserved hypothetical protein [Xenorhabdus innexi]
MFGSRNCNFDIEVKEVTSEEASIALKRILETLDCSWECSEPLYSPRFDNEQIAWNHRYNDTRKILRFLKNNTGSSSNRSNELNKNIFLIAYFRGVPIGASLLCRERNDSLKVRFLATHQGIRGCGALLIESAVNKSKQMGMEGKLELAPLKRAEGAYMNMGFIGNGEYMVLRPNESSEQWMWNEEKQCYKYKLK